MKTIEIQGKLRTNLGKKEAKRLRREEMVPCVLYGKESNIHFAAGEKELGKIIYTPNVYIVALNIEGNVHRAVIRDMQFHPVSDKPLHMDFLPVSDDKKLIISIPVELEGLALGVKQGGKLSLITRRLKAKALPNDLPDTLKVNVDNIGLGQSVKVGQLNFENIELLDQRNVVVAAVKLTRAAKGAADTEAQA